MFFLFLIFVFSVFQWADNKEELMFLTIVRWEDLWGYYWRLLQNQEYLIWIEDNLTIYKQDSSKGFEVIKDSCTYNISTVNG